MTRTIRPFPLRQVNLENSSLCDRRCPECMRNSHPDKEKTAPWFKQNLMPTELIHSVVDQVAALQGDPRQNGAGTTVIYFAHFNEPLLDDRIPDLCRYVKKKKLHPVILSNGNKMTRELAKELDGVLLRMNFSTYGSKKQRQRRNKRVRSYFKKTPVCIKPVGFNPTQHSPTFDLATIVADRIGRACFNPPRAMYINHQGEQLMCCSDFGANFNLGNINDSTIEELWFSDAHQERMRKLTKRGSRRKYPYCSACPLFGRAGPGDDKWLDACT